MLRHIHAAIAAFALAVALSLALTAPALAGGPPSFSFEAPPASGPRTASSPVLIVHAYSCHAPTDAAVEARAEGLVGGERRSIPLALESTGQTGIYEVRRQWPAEGSWALVFSIDRGGRTSALVRLNAAGEPVFEKGSAAAESRPLNADSWRTVSGRATAKDIDEVLMVAALR